MNAIITLAISLAALGATVTLAEALLPRGAIRRTAQICIGLLYVAAVMENIIGIFH